MNCGLVVAGNSRKYGLVHPSSSGLSFAEIRVGPDCSRKKLEEIISISLHIVFCFRIIRYDP